VSSIIFVFGHTILHLKNVTKEDRKDED